MMKLQSALSALLFATVAALSMGAYAADADKAAPAAEMKGKQPNKAAMPHSHVEEKTGMPQHMPAASDEKSGKPKAGKDKSKHLHPRDGK